MVKYIVYDGFSEIFQRDLGSKIVTLKKGMVTAVSDDIAEILLSGKKLNHIFEVKGADGSFIRAMK